MALEIGDQKASSGMSQAIYEQLNTLLSPPLQDMAPADQEKVRDGWRQLAFAIATGVINHLKSNMEIFGVQTSGPVTTTVTGTVSGSTVTGTGTGNVTTNQTGATTGHVR
jgi:hypothetical protein